MNPLVNDRVLYLAAGAILILLALIAALRLRARNGKAQWLSDLDDDRADRRRFYFSELQDPNSWAPRKPANVRHVKRATYGFTIDELREDELEAQRLEDLRKSAAAAYRPTKVTSLRDYSRGPH